MEDRQFDALVKRLAQVRLSRFDALRGVAASALAGLAGVTQPGDESEAKPHHKRKGNKGKGRGPSARHRQKGPATQAPSKVTLCHQPGTPAEQTLQVPPQAVAGHLGHGDYLNATGCCAAGVLVCVDATGHGACCTGEGAVCVNGACCRPTTCAAQGKDCGSISDTCGGTLACGSCTTPETCGGGTPPEDNVCGCTPRTCAEAGVACGTAADGCGGTLTCECTPGNVCVGTPQTCQACSAATAQADLCTQPQVNCGNEDAGEPNPDCFCVRTTSGGSICTRFARSLCNCVTPPCLIPPNTPICQTDADCEAIGYTHCIPATQCSDPCNGGTACAFACFFCPEGQHACKDGVCCPNEQDCCAGVCCAPNEQCRRGPNNTRVCTPV